MVSNCKVSCSCVRFRLSFVSIPFFQRIGSHPPPPPPERPHRLDSQAPPLLIYGHPGLLHVGTLTPRHPRIDASWVWIWGVAPQNWSHAHPRPGGGGGGGNPPRRATPRGAPARPAGLPHFPIWSAHPNPRASGGLRPREGLAKDAPSGQSRFSFSLRNTDAPGRLSANRQPPAVAVPWSAAGWALFQGTRNSELFRLCFLRRNVLCLPREHEPCVPCS